MECAGLRDGGALLREVAAPAREMGEISIPDFIKLWLFAPPQVRQACLDAD